jgi:hypothetical protein
MNNKKAYILLSQHLNEMYAVNEIFFINKGMLRVLITDNEGT